MSNENRASVKATRDDQVLHLVMTDSGLFCGPREHKHKLAYPNPQGELVADTPVGRKMGLPFVATGGEMMLAAIDALVASGAEVA